MTDQGYQRRAELTRACSRRFRDIDEILPSDVANTLSRSAQRLFANLWNRMRNNNTPTLSMRDDKASELARVPITALPNVWDELNRSNLLTVQPYEFPCPVGSERTRYTFKDQHEAAT